MILEGDLCGSGPSGRNGGFVTGWWDEIPGLIRSFGETEALRTVRALDTAIASLAPWCVTHGVDAQIVERGSLQVSAAPSQDDAWLEATEACARLGEGHRWQALSADQVAARVRSPVFRGGAFMRGAAIVQPARLARGLRRVALEQGIAIHERTTATLPADRAGRADQASGAPIEIATTSAEGSGVLAADQVVVATNAWAAGSRPVAGRLLTWSSYIVLTEPIPDRLADIGWTGGEGLSDSRFTLHYARTTPDGRIAIGGGGGRAGFGGRIGRAFTHDAGSARRAAEGLRRWFPSLADVRIEDAWGGPIDITDDHRPWFGTRPGGRIHHGFGYSGNGVGPAILGGRILAALATGRGRDDDRQARGLVVAGAAGRERSEDPAAEDRRGDAVAAVAEAVMDPAAGPRPEPRPVVVGDVDRAAPGVVDPDVGQDREPAPQSLRGPPRRSRVVGERAPDPAAEAGPPTTSADRDPAVRGGSGVVEREPCVRQCPRRRSSRSRRGDPGSAR